MSGIFLIGFMGAGKTTVGQLLAQEMQQAHLDLDAMIVEEIGMSIQAYFAVAGETAFRKKENDILARTLASPAIVSTGGGIVLSKENRTLLQKVPHVVYLKTEPGELIARLEADQENVRPLVLSKTPDEIQEIYLSRVPLYEESANIIVETTDKTPAQIVQEILTQVGE